MLEESLTPKRANMSIQNNKIRTNFGRLSKTRRWNLKGENNGYWKINIWIKNWPIEEDSNATYNETFEQHYNSKRDSPIIKRVSVATKEKWWWNGEDKKQSTRNKHVLKPQEEIVEKVFNIYFGRERNKEISWWSKI